MKILLIDADSIIPNLPLMKLSAYHKSKGDKVTLIKLNIPYYPHIKKPLPPYIPPEYDKKYCSVVFERTLNSMQSTQPLFGLDNIIFGGTGYSLKIKLPDHIENLNPDYSIYPDNDISYGFISRGCIRKCYFCKVPEKEGKIHQVNNVSDIVQHKKVKFLDNNFLALPNHKQILKELVDKKISCCFNQGLDIRLVDKENSLLLSKLRYLGEYIFAFDDWSYLKIIKKKLPLLSWRNKWQLKFFVYCHPNMELKNIVKRLEFLRTNKCLPYLMRDITCFKSKNAKFYSLVLFWSNNPGLFKGLTFSEYIKTNRTLNRSRNSFDKYISLYENNK